MNSVAPGVEEVEAAAAAADAAAEAAAFFLLCNLKMKILFKSRSFDVRSRPYFISMNDHKLLQGLQ